jgi:hypothetical protein
VRADAVILTPSGPVIVEVKTLGDDVEGSLWVPVNDEWCDASGPLDLITHGAVNPVGQASGYATELRNLKRPGFGSDPPEGESDHAQEVRPGLA